MNEIVDSTTEHSEMLLKAWKRIAELESAVRWALGETEDFPQRKEGQGAYWWRTELRTRAAVPYLPPQEQSDNE